MITSVRTGHGCGLNTTSGWLSLSYGMSIRRAITLWARVVIRLAIATASPSWSRASSYDGSIADPGSTSWNWLNSTCFQADSSRSRG